MHAIAPKKWEVIKSTFGELFSLEKSEKVINKTALAKVDLQQPKTIVLNSAVQKLQKKELVNPTSPTAVSVAATMAVAVTTSLIYPTKLKTYQ